MNSQQVVGSKVAVKDRKPRASRKPRNMPRYKVVLLNDEVNDFADVVKRVQELTPLNKEDVVGKVTEAHKTGCSLLLVTHKERAELYREQFASLQPPIGISIEAEE